MTELGELAEYRDRVIEAQNVTSPSPRPNGPQPGDRVSDAGREETVRSF